VGIIAVGHKEIERLVECCWSVIVKCVHGG
jgi:hypothetical protein